MAETSCPKCGHKALRVQPLVVEGRLAGGGGVVISSPLSHRLDAHICEKCGFVAALYYRGRAF